MKTCFACNVMKEKTEFSKNKSRKDGIQSACKDCHKIYKSEHYKANKKIYLEKSKRYRLEFAK